MRGKPQFADDGNRYRRNIPAYAGKTVYEFHMEYLKEEHPRVCGENP